MQNWIFPPLEMYQLRNQPKLFNPLWTNPPCQIPGTFLTLQGGHIPFFPNVHHTFTWIDYFLLDNRFLSSAHSCSYDATVISDHAPVILEIQFEDYSVACPAWCLNTRLLYLTTNLTIFCR